MKILMLDTITYGDDISLDKFKTLGEVITYRTSTQEEALQRIKEIQPDVVVTNKVVITKELFEASPNIKMVAETATGYNNIDIEYAKAHQIRVANVAGYSTESVVQHTFALLFYVYEKLRYYDEYVKSGEYVKSPCFTHFDKVFNELSGKTWGIAGLGSIGRRVADVAKAFGCRVVYFSASGHTYDTEFTGEIILDGEKVEINNPDEAMKKGIAMVHQELQPVPARSVAENMYLGRFPTKCGPLKVIDHKKMYEDTAKWLKEVKMDFDPKAQLGSLSIGQMQSVEIAKAVSQQAKVIIFDEPTSSLSDNEVEALFRIMNDLRDKGVAMVYISHKMDEIKRIADDITVMRDGTYVGTWPAAEMTTDQIITKMVGRELTNVYPPRENKPGDEVVMEVKNLCSIHAKSFQNVSFQLHKGEILGFGGLVGAQRTELMEGIFGIRGIASGEIYMHGKKVKIKHPIDAMNAGIGLITEDRRGNGIFGCLSIKDNVGVSIYNKYLNAGFVLNHKKINEIVTSSIKKLSIKTPSMKEHISNLSGGNQQKVIVARWLANDPDVLIMDEPTRGIDVGAKHEIYEIMCDLAKQGKAIIMISSEMSELLGMSDRICVMCNGKLTGEVKEPEDMTQAKIMEYATRF